MKKKGHALSSVKRAEGGRRNPPRGSDPYASNPFSPDLFQKAPIGIYIVQDRKFRFVNPEFERNTGYRYEELLTMDSLELVLPEYREFVKDQAVRMLKGECSSPYEFQVVTKNGEIRWILETVTSIPFEGRRAVLGYYMDITEHRQMEETLNESEERYRTAIEYASDGIAIYENGRFLFVNQKFAEMFGYDRTEEFVGKPGFLVVHPDDRKRVIHYYRQRFIGEEIPSQLEFRGIRRDGKVIDIEASTTATTYRGKPVQLAYLRDITERKRIEKALLESERKYKELSITDSLTGLFNMRHFYDQLATEIERSHRYGRCLSLLLMDIDNFKDFNDQYGHLEGDQVLIRLGQVIRASLRRVDSAYRYGGEEFTAILPETEGRRATVVAERIRKGFEREAFYPRQGIEAHKTVSIGVTRHEPGEEISALIKRVDQAMYEAKRLGKNRTFFAKGR